MSHHPRLIVQAGSSLADLKDVAVNSDKPHDVSSASFEGNVAIRIQDYLGPEGKEGKSSPDSEFLKESTMSVVLQGRFLEEVDLDDVAWGNQWEEPLRDSLPYGTAAVIKFAHYVDPGLSMDVYSDKPWAVSPLVVTMDYLSVQPHPSSDPLPPFKPVIEEDIEPLFSSGNEANKAFEAETEGLKGHREKRKKWALDAVKRKATKLDKNVVIAADFCNGYIDFKTLSLKLPIGMSFPLEKYWDGQPVTFVCRNRAGTKTFFLVTFQIVKEGSGEKTHAAPEPAKEAPKPESAGEEVDELGID